jgi:hypothetical protein
MFLTSPKDLESSLLVVNLAMAKLSSRALIELHWIAIQINLLSAGVIPPELRSFTVLQFGFSLDSCEITSSGIRSWFREVDGSAPCLMDTKFFENRL